MRGLVDRKLVKAASNFIAGRPNALLFCFLVVIAVVCLIHVILVVYIFIKTEKIDVRC